MKKIFRYILIAGLSLGLMSCDKFFDSMEGDLSKVAAEDLLSSESGLLALLANLYSALPDMSMSSSDQNQMFANGSRSKPGYGKSTASFWNYTNVRAVNVFMNSVKSAEASGMIDPETASAYIGEAKFIRAYYYFAMVRTLGGVPILDHILDDEPLDSESLYIPRSTEKDTWDWVIKEFQEASDLLPANQAKEMRANKYTALAMKARAALWAASESKYWNRAPLNSGYEAVQKKLTYMEESYASVYYQQAIDAAKAVIDSGKYGLVGANPASVSAAVQTMIDLFQKYDTREGIFGRNYSDSDTSTGNGTQGWGCNQVITGYQQGTYSVSLNIADVYDNYADPASDRSHVSGKIQTLVNGDEDAYFTDPQEQFTKDMVASYKHYASVADPFLVKDARFQAWVCYPGCTFRNTLIYNEGGMVLPNGDVQVYPINNTGVDFKGTTYFPYGGEGDNNSFFYKLEVDSNTSNRSFFSFQIRKGLDEGSNNPNPETPWYNMRYSEILLTYAEAVAESGLGDRTLAAKCLNDVRKRAGFTDEVALTIDNIIHEWKCEFAFENQWTNVLYRRRGFYSQSSTSMEEGTLGQKLTLIPMVDLSGDEAQWIFLRTLPYCATVKYGYTGQFDFKADQYYDQVSNYVKNKIVPNNMLAQ